MKLLSCKLHFIDSFNLENLYQIIGSWLKGENYTDDLAVRFDEAENKLALKLESQYCKLETTKIDGYFLFRLINYLGEQKWTTEVIYEDLKKSVTLHICCDGDTSRLSQELPLIRTEILRVFVKSGLLKQGRVPITDMPVTVGENLKSWLVSTIKGDEVNTLPVVFLTRYDGMLSYAVDENALARDLAGIAHVAVEGETDLAFSLKSVIKDIPFNGYIGVYYPEAKKSKTYKTDYDKRIKSEIIRHVTAYTDRDSVDWDKLKTRENCQLVDLVDVETQKLKSQLAAANEEISRLNAKVQHLQAAFDSVKNTNGLIKASDERELYDFEQNDLIVCALNLYFKGCVEGTRSFDLCKSLLAENDYKSGKQEDFDRIKAILDKGRLNERDFAELKKLGLDLKRQGDHYNMTFMGDERYTIIISCTPSDPRGGLNTSSDALNKVSIFK